MTLIPRILFPRPRKAIAIYFPKHTCILNASADINNIMVSSNRINNE